MRIGLVIGRSDPTHETAQAALESDEEPKLRASSLLVSLQDACVAQGWDADIVVVGENVKQTIQAPDVFVNLICEPLVNTGALKVMAQYERQLPITVLNPSAAVHRSARTALAETLSGQDRVRVPMSTLYDPATGSLIDHVAHTGHAWPVLARPVGLHGGKGLTMIKDAEKATGLRFTANGIISDFVDFASVDGLYRKYRCIWACGQLFRRHLIVADQWNIKGESRVFMVGRDDLISEEKAFLAQGPDALDQRIAALFKASGLDFGVVDFGLSESGEITVFELNACFQIAGSIPDDKRERWGYLEDTNAPITDALLAALQANARPQNPG